MKDILIKNGQELNALFIQPTAWCAHNCKGCYSLAHQNKFQVDFLEWQKLFRVFYEDPQYWANQITISIDKLSKITSRRYQMSLIIDFIFNIINQDHRLKNNKPAITFTVHSLDDLQEYFESEDCYLDWSKIDGLAISTFTAKDISQHSWLLNFIKKAGVSIIYNLLAYNKEQVLKDIQLVFDLVDTIHVVMFKNLNEGDALAIKTLADYVEIKWAVEKSAFLSKVVFDRCYNACITETGCSAGTTLMQVWPDGSVSGCPYTKISDTKGGNTSLKILDNIKERILQNCESNCVYKEMSK
jgi:hypothetical protein